MTNAAQDTQGGEIATISSQPSVAAKSDVYLPQTFDQAMTLAEHLAKSKIVPKDYQGDAASVFAAMSLGSSVGLNPMQSVQNIATINGRPSLWGDAIPAIIKNHPKYGGMEEWYDDKTSTAHCIMKRKGDHDVHQTFSMTQAQQAGLTGKQGPWQNYPKRMCQMRARAFAARDQFPDALKGLSIAEEVMDIEPRDMGSIEREPEDAEPQVIPVYPDEKFKTNLPKWLSAIKAGKKTPDDIINTVESAYTLTDKQKQQIRGEKA